jgi:hypothetical protein
MCLADISALMSAHHLKLNLDKTELLFLPGNACPLKKTSPSQTTTPPCRRDPGQHPVVLCNHQSSDPLLQVHVLYNIRGVRLYLTQEVAQVLIQAVVISHLDHCNSLLAPCLCHQTPGTDPEHSSPPGIQPHVTY